MTKEEAKVFLYSIAGDLGFRDVENYTCKDGEKMREAIMTLEEETPCCEETVSRQVVKEQMIKYGFHAPDMTVTEFVEDLPPVNPQEKTGHCKDCKYGMPFIGAHEICLLWGGGCKTKEDGYCFLYEPKA